MENNQLVKGTFEPIEKRFIELADKNTFDKECSFAMQLFNKNKYLNSATTESKLIAVLNVANIGLTLNPALKHAYLVPRSRNVDGKFIVEACLEPSYQGLVKLITDTGSAISVYAHIVYKGDEFQEVLGTSIDIIHKPKRTSTEIELVYAVAILHNGSKQVDVMPLSEINEIRAMSESYKAWEKNKSLPCVWNTHFGEMARKTVIRRLTKYLPKTNQWEKVAKAIELDNSDYKASSVQVSIIEGLLITAAITEEEKQRIDRELNDLSSHEAVKLINYLKENNNETDPAKRHLNYKN
jgi:recombination protein RecT